MFTSRFKSFSAFRMKQLSTVPLPTSNATHSVPNCPSAQRNGGWGSLFRWLAEVTLATDCCPHGRWPVRPLGFRRVNEELDDKELDAVSLVRSGVASVLDAKLGGVVARRLDLESTLRARGRPKRSPYQAINERKSPDPFFFVVNAGKRFSSPWG